VVLYFPLCRCVAFGLVDVTACLACLACSLLFGTHRGRVGNSSVVLAPAVYTRSRFGLALGRLLAATMRQYVIGRRCRRHKRHCSIAKQSTVPLFLYGESVYTTYLRFASIHLHCYIYRRRFHCHTQKSTQGLASFNLNGSNKECTDSFSSVSRALTLLLLCAL
jgi:hypothetical protein